MPSPAPSNLEHAAASLENVLQALVLVALLAIPVVAYATPELVWGWVIGSSGVRLVRATGLPSEVVGFTLTTALTSLPELVVLVAAMRMGALTLGVGNIIGGNVFDTLMIAVADVSYTDGSVYAAAGPSSLVLLGGTILITTLLAGGLVMRDRKGIGFEGVSLPLVYAGTVALAVVVAT